MSAIRVPDGGGATDARSAVRRGAGGRGTAADYLADGRRPWSEFVGGVRRRCRYAAPSRGSRRPPLLVDRHLSSLSISGSFSSSSSGSVSMLSSDMSSSMSMEGAELVDSMAADVDSVGSRLLCSRRKPAELPLKHDACHHDVVAYVAVIVEAVGSRPRRRPAAATPRGTSGGFDFRLWRLLRRPGRFRR